jgi:hypothetical protein
VESLAADIKRDAEGLDDALEGRLVVSFRRGESDALENDEGAEIERADLESGGVTLGRGVRGGFETDGDAGFSAGCEGGGRTIRERRAEELRVDPVSERSSATGLGPGLWISNSVVAGARPRT